MTDSNVIAQDLNHLLADYQILYQKLRTYHWNVTGPMFFSLHEKFEELYLDAANKVDEIAERIAALGSKPLPTLKAQLEAARLAEDASTPNASEMVTNLAADLDRLIGLLRDTSAKAEADSTTLNLLEGFADEHSKTAWMLRAYLAS